MSEGVQDRTLGRLGLDSITMSQPLATRRYQCENMTCMKSEYHKFPVHRWAPLNPHRLNSLDRMRKEMVRKGPGHRKIRG